MRRLSFLACPTALAMLTLAMPASSHADPNFTPTTVTNPGDPALRVPTPVRRRHMCGQDCSVPTRRGIAILPPIESPDCYDPPVGGKTVFTHYYPDYCPHRHHGPRILIPGNGIGYVGRCLGVGVPGPYVPDLNAQATGVPGYGNFSGARQDEANLSRLGGFSPADASAMQGGAPDLIDELEGRRVGP